jgi:hypothetical protein
MSTVTSSLVRNALALIISLFFVGSQARADDDPAQAVRSWYDTVRSASWVEAGYGGTMGDLAAYSRAYRMLAQSLRESVSEKSFIDLFANTVYIRLNQAEPISVQGGHATVFVEDQRDMVLRGLPATVHFYGTVTLVREANGWAIDGFQIAPEASMIALRDFGHSSAGSIVDASLAQIAQYIGARSVDVKRLNVPPNVAEGPVTVTYSDGKNSVAMELAKLHSGAYIPLVIRDLSPTRRKPRVLFDAPSEAGQYCPAPWCMKLPS